MICGNGIDVHRDTEEQIENAIHLFPEVISKKTYSEVRYPIHELTAKVIRNEISPKAILFVPLLARLGIELDQFEEEERGRLLIKKELYQCEIPYGL